VWLEVEAGQWPLIPTSSRMADSLVVGTHWKAFRKPHNVGSKTDDKEECAHDPCVSKMQEEREMHFLVACNKSDKRYQVDASPANTPNTPSIIQITTCGDFIFLTLISGEDSTTVFF
jgi:hypothetical protein